MDQNLTKKYPFIVVWGQEMGSYPYYIDSQLQKAEKDNAPHSAIYERDGQWTTFKECRWSEDKMRKFYEKVSLISGRQYPQEVD